MVGGEAKGEKTTALPPLPPPPVRGGRAATTLSLASMAFCKGKRESNNHCYSTTAAAITPPLMA